MKKIEELNSEKQNLISSIRLSGRLSGEYKKELERIKQIEKEVYRLESEKTINSFNKENQRKKALLTLIFEAEKLKVEYFKNDGYFTINALKKLPKWSIIINEYKYIHVRFRSDCIDIRVGNDLFYLKENFDLNQFLDYNNIKNDLNISDYIHLCREFEKLNEEFKQFEKNYSNKLKELRAYDFNKIGLINQNSSRLYEYIPTKNFIK